MDEDIQALVATLCPEDLNAYQSCQKIVRELRESGCEEADSCYYASFMMVVEAKARARQERNDLIDAKRSGYYDSADDPNTRFIRIKR